MLDFLSMFNDYEDRVIARHEADDLIVDTAAVSDSAQPFETGISHRNYNGGDWVIVQLYDTREEAETGHRKWIYIMTADELPNTLRDASSAGIANLLDTLQGDSDWREIKSI